MVVVSVIIKMVILFFFLFIILLFINTPDSVFDYGSTTHEASE